ncbi:helix-turn-helix transcriptional regulator [Conexibacter sp. CPCC 206217]|uniref:helix-turn-helix transcriptional regulator n=1 Tax=Conexibacter sp. CPCC 206217 TaxID=3064574 RepID=UPI0027180744|nr:helix-turn-helix transcriptional regulator [Conexibacter sp. CPCC 206217]MDO8212086.1 helix-turn-helix transcriptional regulator [Conexibacter sp. CPCC 206217]
MLGLDVEVDGDVVHGRPSRALDWLAVTRSMINRNPAGQQSRTDPGTGSATLPPAGLDRQRELADFLRRRRAQIAPEQAGLPAPTGHRRTPGLRREELAALSGISVDWYIRLEQGRAERPSPSVLDSLAGALQLTPDERSHLYALARSEQPPLHQPAAETVDPSMQRILHSLADDVAAYVLGRRWDVLAWNRAACELLVDFDALPPARRNLIELTFLDAAMRDRYLDWQLVARSTLANFRAAVARNLEQPETAALVDHLRTTDAHFMEWWNLHEVQEKTAGVKRFRGPDRTSFEMRYESVLSPTAPDQRLIIYTAVAES